jgi:hypothetical protein
MLMRDYVITGCVLSQAVRHRLFAEAEFDLELFRAGFVADKVALGQVFSEYFGLFPGQYHSTSSILIHSPTTDAV